MNGGKVTVSYRIICSSRKTIAIQIGADGEVVVRCPRRMSADAIRAFVESKSQWIGQHLEKQKSVPKQPAFSDDEIRNMTLEAKGMIPARVAHFAPIVNVAYGRITIRSQRSRWGSCSSKGNLNFNCLLTLVPPEVLDYVVVHELCHRKEMNHSKRFWAEVERILPDYRIRKKWLRENGGQLISRLAGKPSSQE